MGALSRSNLEFSLSCCPTDFGWPLRLMAFCNLILNHCLIDISSLKSLGKGYYKHFKCKAWFILHWRKKMFLKNNWIFIVNQLNSIIAMSCRLLLCWVYSTERRCNALFWAEVLCGDRKKNVSQVWQASIQSCFKTPSCLPPVTNCFPVFRQCQ